MESAVKPEISVAPDRVLVAFDSQSTGIREVQLMARLVKDFPGANTRVILMLDKLSSTQYEKKIQAFGNKIIRWDIATPTDREAAVLLSESEISGMQPEVRQALANVGVSLDAKLALAASSKALNRAEKTLSNESSNLKTEEISTKNPNNDTNHRQTVKEDEKSKSSEKDDGYKKQKDKQKKRIERINALVATLFLICVSGGVMAWVTVTEALSVEKIVAEMRNFLIATDEVEKLREIHKNGKVTNNKPIESEVLKPITSVSQKQENTVFDLGKSDTSETINRGNQEKEASLEEISNGIPQPEKLLSNTSETVNGLSVDLKNPQIKKDEVLDKKNTLQLMPGFYVQHTARPTMELARELKSKYPSLSKSKILKLKKTKSDGHFFVLVSGPFSTLEEAKSFTTRDDIPEGTWIRGAIGMRPLMVPIE